MKLHLRMWILILFISCNQSSVFIVKYIDYNIQDEGFLNHNVIQTIGISELRNDAEDKPSMQEKCLIRSENIAKERLVSVMIHTHQSIRSNVKSNAKTFNEDYPEKFSKGELIFWSLFFQTLLEKSKIVFQEIHQNSCKVVLRLQEEGLLEKIRNWKGD